MARPATARLPLLGSLLAGGLLACGAAQAQTGSEREVPMLGPESLVSVQSLALGEGRAVFAGSFGKGIFKSEDGGRSWQAVNDGLTDPFVYVVMVGPDKAVYAGTLRGGVFRSRDAGKSWAPANAGLDRLETHVLAHHQGILYAGTGSGVFRSKDGGDRWAADNEGLSNLLIRALAVDAQGTMYAGTTGMGIYRKLPGTSKWIRITAAQLSHPRDRLPENFVRVLAVDGGGDLYAGTADNGVYVSHDRGESWRAANKGLENASVRDLAIGEAFWFVGTGLGMFRSEDRGKSWTAINEGLTERSIQAIAVGKDRTLYAGTSGGIFKTEDGGTRWTSTNQGIGTARKPVGPAH